MFLKLNRLKKCCEKSLPISEIIALEGRRFINRVEKTELGVTAGDRNDVSMLLCNASSNAAFWTDWLLPIKLDGITTFQYKGKV